jgi:hypothetical protein
MAGKTLTPGQNYGDGMALSNLKRQGGTSGAVVQKAGAGRPAAAPMVPVTPVVAQTPQAEVPAEQVNLMRQYAQASVAAARWAQLAQAADAGPWIQYYNQTAQQQLTDLASRLKRETPDYIGS